MKGSFRELVNAWALLKTISDYEVQKSITSRLHGQGGWRAFFDPIAHEWKQTSMDEKLDFLGEIMQATGADLETIIYLYKKDYGVDRPDIVAVADSGIARLLQHAITGRMLAKK